MTTTRMIQPQMARPVAVAAGLCFSTVSVKRRHPVAVGDAAADRDQDDVDSAKV